MNDKQKIKAKIGKLKSEYNKESDFRTVRGDTAREVLDKLLSFIDSMPEEPVSESIEDELERFAYSLPHSADGFWPKDIDCKSVEARTKYGVHHAWSYEQVKKIARHFANWQKEQMMQKAVEATVCEMSEQHGRMVCAWFGCKTEEYYDLDDEVKIIIIKEEEK